MLHRSLFVIALAAVVAFATGCGHTPAEPKIFDPGNQPFHDPNDLKQPVQRMRFTRPVVGEASDPDGAMALCAVPFNERASRFPAMKDEHPSVTFDTNYVVDADADAAVRGNTGPVLVRISNTDYPNGIAVYVCATDLTPA
jgi:hypothetical protein